MKYYQYIYMYKLRIVFLKLINNRTMMPASSQLDAKYISTYISL